MAQFILDCFPDAISEYGLAGCYLAISPVLVLLCLGWIFYVRTR